MIMCGMRKFLHFERVVEYLLSEYELQFLTISEIK